MSGTPQKAVRPDLASKAGEAASRELDETSANQSRAADPTASAWVSANAGTGKTYVLVRRVLRLALGGTPPEKILCLTYTNAAAAEMSNRLYKEMGRWAVMPETELQGAFEKLTGKAPGEEQIRTARVLFARTLETPGSLKVQTIHSFCDRLLSRFPLEAGIPPNSSLLDEAGARELKQEVLEKVLSKAVNKPQSELYRALMVVIAFATEDRFAEVIEQALSRKDHIRELLRHTGDGMDPVQAASDDLRATFGIGAGQDENAIHDQLAALLTDDELSAAANALSQGSTNDRKLADKFSMARFAESREDKIEALSDAFLTKKGEPKKDSFITKKSREANMALVENLMDAKTKFYELWRSLRALRVVNASGALLRLADAVLGEYESAKAKRAMLDFDDLIAKTADLLSRSGAAPWVLYKLDGGIDHILVDEAQDTSPKQWRLISSLVEEFFAGQGTSETQRTVFAVGDEKQSIYSFQGAVPAKFAAMGAMLRDKVETAGSSWHQVPLTLSFRSTSMVLNAVDAVFNDRAQTPGVSFNEQTIKHGAFRQGHAGRVEIWPVEIPDKQDASDVWDPLADVDLLEEPKERLANSIARRIRFMLDHKVELPARGRAVEPSDILILVRKRQPFAQPMIRALKKLDIPVAGADRMQLTDQIAVMDLLVLGQFLLMPQDDLSLATVLKSPLFGLDDDDLFAIGHGRKASFWQVLNQKVEEGDDPESCEKYMECVALLRRWLKRTDKVPPYELFAGILEQDGMRMKLIERLGSEAGDALDEFMNLAISYDDGAPPSLQGFIDHLQKSGSEIKRDMEQGNNEVRLMTVHGAKGLEANIVFLPDTCPSPGSLKTGSLLEIPRRNPVPGKPDHLIWAVSKSGEVEEVKAAREEKVGAAWEEYNRLLYVAMTRARDQLYICGWEGKRGRDKNKSWYDLVYNALEKELSVEEIADQSVMVMQDRQIVEVDDDDDDRANAAGSQTLPEWALREAPQDELVVNRLSPSSLIPPELADDARENRSEQWGDDHDMDVLGSARLMRGTLTHALLEHLPGLDPARWDAAAGALTRAYEGELAAEMLQGISTEALAILRHPDFAALFGAGSQAEVPLAIEVPPRKPGKPVTRMSGIIDRLVVTDTEVLIIDYKTNRDPPSRPEDVSSAYVAQLAAYRHAIARIFSDKDVRCGLLWTQNAQLMWIEHDHLTRYDNRIASVASATLDVEPLDT